MKRAASSRACAAGGETSPTVSHLAGKAAQALEGFSPKQVSDLSDKELEAHIESCAWLMERAMQNYYETGNFADRGEADRWRVLMEEAIKSRRPAHVARMEWERGLA